MARSERLAEQLDWHWRENLRPRMDGLTDRFDFRAFAYAGTADEALLQLDETYQKWNAGIRGLSDIDLDRAVGPTEGPDPFPMEGLVLHINRELIHHGAEISLPRDLYRWRD